MRLPLRTGLPGVLAAAFLVTVGVPAPAAAAGAGGTTAPVPGSTAPSAPSSGGTAPGAAPATPQQPGERRRKPRATPRPVLASFAVGTRRFYDLGRPARVTFRVDGRSATVRARLLVLQGGKRVRTIDLGDRATGRRHAVAFTGREGGRLPEGNLQLRLTARDPRGRGLRASSRASDTGSLGFYWHRFPIAGPFTYGAADGRFGADRPGRQHQGQDLLAPSGTPIVAPRAGVVKTVAYQAGGAGHYIVVKAHGEDRTYAFMHLLDGSIRVRAGDRVATGERLGDVGSTGSSTGPHLHFEIWSGAWQAGGRAIDPLPLLRRWDAWS